jgi:lauroyl/myristoyl acyltransferase
MNPVHLVRLFGPRLCAAVIVPALAAVRARRQAAAQPWIIDAIGAALRLRAPAARRLHRHSVGADLRFQFDYAWLAGASEAQVARALAATTIEHLERLDPVVASGKPVILLSIHMGSFYMGFLKLAQSVDATREIHVVKMAPASAQEAALHKQAEQKFGRIRALRFDDDVGKQAYLALRRGGVVALMNDVEVRVTAREPVSLFGHRCHMQSGVARLAASTGATIVPLINFSTPSGTRVVRLEVPLAARLPGEAPAASVQRLMQAIAALMEQWIAIDPAQCHSWQHLAWTMHQEQHDKLDRRSQTLAPPPPLS